MSAYYHFPAGHERPLMLLHATAELVRELAPGDRKLYCVIHEHDGGASRRYLCVFGPGGQVKDATQQQVPWGFAHSPSPNTPVIEQLIVRSGGRAITGARCEARGVTSLPRGASR